MQAPGDSARWFVAEKGGIVRVFANDQNTATAGIFLDISGFVNASGEGGLLGLTFHPNFPATPEEVILTVDQPATNHNGGNIAFGPDGFLYVGFGDGGGSGGPNGNSQDTSTLMGAIVRLDVEGGSPYGIPAGNPFEANVICTGGSGVENCPEIYAWGLRNPWRFSFDTVTSKLWVGDVGQANWEEVDVITVGGNYGWNVREGAHCFNPRTVRWESSLRF